MSSCVFGCLRSAKNICSNITLAYLTLKMPFYAVASGRAPGVFQSWAECERQVKGFQGARYKKFNTPEEAARFVSGGGQNVQASTFRAYTAPARPSAARPAKPSVPKAKKAAAPAYTPSSSNEEVHFDNIDDINDAIMRKIHQMESDIGEIKENVSKKSQKPKNTILIDPMPAVSLTMKRPSELISGATDAKKRRIDISHGGQSYKFDTDDSGYVVVYTDGACSSNGTKAARAGLGVYFGEDHPLNISEPVSGRATNNCGEIQATTRAIRLAHSMGIQKLSINTDSQFVINSVTKWMNGWKRKGWKLATGGPVKNEIDFKELDTAVKLLDVKWVYVNAHKGIHGNERADELAKAGAAKYGK